MKLPLHQLPGNSDPFTFVLRADIAFKEKFIGQLRGRLFGAVEQCIAQAAVFVRDGDQSFAAFIRALQGRAQTTMNASSRQSSHRNRLHLILEDDLSRVMGELGRVVVEHAHGLVELEERYRRVVASDLRTYPRSRDFVRPETFSDMHAVQLADSSSHRSRSRQSFFDSSKSNDTVQSPVACRTPNVHHHLL